MTQLFSRHVTERHRTTVMSILLVTSATSIVMCLGTNANPFSSKRKYRLMPSDFRPQYNQIYQVEKLKAQILRGLNLTTEPEPPTKKPPQSISILNRLPIPHNRTHNRSPVPDAIVWSEPVGTTKAKADQLLFRVNSQKEKSTVINRVILRLRLRFKQHSKKKRKTKVKARKRAKGKLPAMRGKDVQGDDPNSSGGKRKSKSKKKGGKSKSRRKKSRRVKVLVQVKNDQSGKFKRVAVQRVTVSKKFSWIKLPIPASLVSHATQSANQSLVLRVRCKRCPKAGVSIDSALPRKKSSVSSSDSNFFRSLNPNRPYLVICTANTPLTTRAQTSLTRSARHVNAVMCPSESNPSSSCCADRVTVTFKDFGWDHWIVYPEEFSTVVCNACESQSYFEESGQTVVPKLNGQTVPSEEEKSSGHRPDIDAAVFSRASFRKANQKDTQYCRPQYRSSLTLMYYTDKNTLISATIPDLISSGCVCSLAH